MGGYWDEYGCWQDDARSDYSGGSSYYAGSSSGQSGSGQSYTGYPSTEKKGKHVASSQHSSSSTGELSARSPPHSNWDGVRTKPGTPAASTHGSIDSTMAGARSGASSTYKNQGAGSAPSYGTFNQGGQSVGYAPNPSMYASTGSSQWGQYTSQQAPSTAQSTAGQSEVSSTDSYAQKQCSWCGYWSGAGCRCG